MSPLTPIRVYGLEVEAGDMPIPAVPDYFSATLRITMAAIDPSAAPQLDGVPSGAAPRATLKLVRLTPDDEEDDDDEDDDDDDEDDEDDDDIDALERRLKGVISDEEEDDDEESSEDEEEKNGGPSDPAKSKKARKAAAVKQLIEALKNADDDMEVDGLNGVNGTKLDKGKSKASDDDEDDSDFNEDDMNEEIQEFVICTLDPEKNYQQPLDITIGENEVVYFRVEGTHNIYLTGNYVVDPAELAGPDDYDDDEEDLDYEIDSLEDEDEESDELDDIDDPRVTELDSDEEEAPKLIKALDKKGRNKRPADDSDEEVNGLDELINKSLKSDAAATNGETLSKRQAKKLKNNAGQAVAGSEKSKKEEKAADEPKSSKAAEKNSKSDKKVQFAKNLEQGPTGSPILNAAKEDKKESKGKPALGVKSISGGIKVDDRKLGSGPAAKNGDKVSMRYIGKLEKDGKVFDSNKKGKPFSFTLGKGQVIKGWDLGIAGMQVGGERRVTIPAAMGYGSKGMPGIPANSTLVFDVKMLSLN